MKRLLIGLFFLVVSLVAMGQDANTKIITVTPNGLEFKNGEAQMVVENNMPATETISQIVKSLKTKHQSQYLKIDAGDDIIIIDDFVPGYTKTDKAAGSAYLLDMSYKITVDVKDNRFRINIPTIIISANQKYDGHAVPVNKGIQFTMEMGIKGKRDMWNSIVKKLFIYDEKDKLIEKRTKELLERDLSSIINIILSQESDQNW
ncbi:hypothetical protein H8B06_18635 [Sphingobacterium sp. DN00404]|uniref:DUF4468 domain-containing protein n=1 Tax=Sphingobacterium micropteri TaxID=2763501 RepID=A0ABR7YU82_9SPHI|nr:hypothetical protein [Sphingobacterium micropteri]MBD1434847.1 hypothetical protein [Sphingobacterium micropteri]